MPPGTVSASSFPSNPTSSSQAELPSPRLGTVGGFPLPPSLPDAHIISLGHFCPSSVKRHSPCGLGSEKQLSSWQGFRQPRQHRPGPTLYVQPVPTGSAGQHLSRHKDRMAGWLAMGSMPPAAPHPTDMASCYSGRGRREQSC